MRIRRMKPRLLHRVRRYRQRPVEVVGSEYTYKNPEMERLMKKLAACVGVFSHSAVNNDKLKEMQTLHEESQVLYELVRRKFRPC